MPAATTQNLDADHAYPPDSPTTDNHYLYPVIVEPAETENGDTEGKPADDPERVPKLHPPHGAPRTRSTGPRRE